MAEDYSEKYNVADQYPEKLRELQDEFLIEAARHNVFPMLKKAFHGATEGAGEQMYPKRPVQETRLEFCGIYRPYDLAESNRINLDTASHYVDAQISRKSSSEEGVIFSTGDKFSGFTFYIKDNHLKYVYNYAKEAYYTAVSDIEVPEGEVSVRYAFVVNEDKTANVTIFINGKPVGQTKVKQFYYMKGFSSTIRADKYTPVSPEYEVPFEFQGQIKKIVFHTAASEIDTKEELEKFMNQE